MDAMKIRRQRVNDVLNVCIERLLDTGEGRTHDVGRGKSRSRRIDLGATLWGGLAILLVKIAFAVLILLVL